MKKFVVLVFIFLSTIGISFAQEADEKEATSRLDILKKELSLTDEQAGKVKEAIKKRRVAVKEANRKAKQEAQETFDGDMKTILNAEQLKKFEERKEDMSTPQGRAERLTNRLEKQLTLNEEQAKKTEAAALTRFTKLAEIEKGKENKDARKAVNQAFDAEMKTILTAEQFTKFEAGKKEHGKGKGKGKGK